LAHRYGGGAPVPPSKNEGATSDGDLPNPILEGTESPAQGLLRCLNQPPPVLRPVPLEEEEYISMTPFQVFQQLSPAHEIKAVSARPNQKRYMDFER